jgi:hypothetical protein
LIAFARRRFPQLAATVCLALAGCGGSEEHEFHLKADTTVTAGSLTKARFLVRANRACRHGWRSIIKFHSEYSRLHRNQLNDEQLFAQSVRHTFFATLDVVIFDPIHLMPAPSGEASDVEAVIGRLQRAVEFAERRVPIRTLAQFAARFEPYNLAAHRYGLDDCLVDGARLLAVQARSGRRPRLHTN